MCHRHGLRRLWSTLQVPAEAAAAEASAAVAAATLSAALAAAAHAATTLTATLTAAALATAALATTLTAASAAAFTAALAAAALATTLTAALTAASTASTLTTVRDCRLARCGRVGRLCGFPRASAATDESIGIDAESEGLAETVRARRTVTAYDNSRCEEGSPFVVTCEMNSEMKKCRSDLRDK